MATYDVELQTMDGVMRNCRRQVNAPSGEQAVRTLVHAMPPQGDGEVYAAYRHRRLGGRRLEGLFHVNDGDDGTAGVREPRRPMPSPGHLEAVRDLRPA